MVFAELLRSLEINYSYLNDCHFVIIGIEIKLEILQLRSVLPAFVCCNRFSKTKVISRSKRNIIVV